MRSWPCFIYFFDNAPVTFNFSKFCIYLFIYLFCLLMITLASKNKLTKCFLNQWLTDRDWSQTDHATDGCLHHWAVVVFLVMFSEILYLNVDQVVAGLFIYLFVCLFIFYI